MGGYYTHQWLKNYTKKPKFYFVLESSLISPVAKGSWYEKFGVNLLPIWMSTIMSKILTKIGCQKNFTCKYVFYRPEHWRTRFFCVPPRTM